MPINLRQREFKIQHAHVKPEFIELIDEMIKERLRQLQDEAGTRFGKTRDKMILASNLLKVIRDPLEHEKMVNTLLSLPYDEFAVQEYAGRTYLVGLTRPITMKCYNYDRDLGFAYDIGRYFVAFRKEIMFGGNVGEIALLPEKNMRVTRRTPHHVATSNPGHPIAWTPYTCLGNFGHILAGAVQQFDIVEYFRIWHTYLSRANLYSVLRDSEGGSGGPNVVDAMPWSKRL